MDQSIAEIGNHSHTHAHLIRKKPSETTLQWRERVIDEIQTAQQLINQNLNKPTLYLFAYPYGEYSLELLQIMNELGYAAMGQQSGPLSGISTKALIPRFPMGGIYTKKAQLIEKLKTYPLPLTATPVVDPIVPVEAKSAPLLQLTIQPEYWNEKLMKQLQCYVSGQGKAQIRWENNTAFIQAEKPLKAGRNRYNCTAPVAVKQNNKLVTGYYWFSQLWIKRLDNSQWYRE
jgi:peptidoglycan/xylan/chitin deacetylase (PgdA/CDA1 family)